MGSVTMSGFNNIDWGAVLDAVMKQESQPLTYLQSQRSALSSRSTAYGVLAGWVGSLESKIADLASAGSLGGRSAATTDATTVAASASSLAQVGTYDVVVTKLARAQVTATTPETAAAGPDAVVAAGGSLVINGKTVTLAGDTTLQQLSEAINGTADIGVRSTVIAADGRYQLVLTGTETGQAHAFEVTNNLAYPPAVPVGSQLAFSATNAVNASDADLTVNNVRVTNSTNTVADAISGVSLTLFKESATPTVITVGEDSSGTKSKLQAFVSAYNDLVGYLKTQGETAKNGDTGSIGRDAVLRSMRSELNRAILGGSASGGSLRNLTEIGIEFQRDGTLTFNATTFDEKAQTQLEDIQSLLAGTSAADGAFDAIKTVIGQYTNSSGLLLSAKSRLTEELAKLDDRVSDMQERLAVRRLALLKEYAAADSAISTLNAQGNSLGGLSSGYRLY
jgi:flagellar hook-associated protein 2